MNPTGQFDARLEPVLMLGQPQTRLCSHRNRRPTDGLANLAETAAVRPQGCRKCRVAGTFAAGPTGRLSQERQAHEGIAKHGSQYALCVHDKSHLRYKHINKTGTYAITHTTDVGYNLQTSLIVSDQKGQPVAQRWLSTTGVTSAAVTTPPLTISRK